MSNDNLEEKLVPEIRFSEFEDKWIEVKLKNISKRISRKNKNLETERPLTISAQYGLVDQEEYFHKTVASKNLEGYYLLNKGEFAYNKSYSNGYPYGAIKRLDKYDKGAISTLYICFELKDNINSEFLKEYFETSNWYKEMYKIAVEGARNHGLLNIPVKEFFETKHKIPKSIEEQKKIGEFLNIINKKIELLEKNYLSTLKYKESLKLKFFSDGKSTPLFRISNYNEEWVEKSIDSLFDKITDYVAAGSFADIKKNVQYRKDPDFAQLIRTADLKNNFKNDDFVYVDKNAFEYLWRVNLNENCIVLPNIGNVGEVYLVKPKDLPYENNVLAPNAILLKSREEIEFKYHLLDSAYFRYKLGIINESSGRGKFNKTNLKKIKLLVPKSQEEQNEIAKFISLADKKISLLEKELNDFNDFKKGLLQKMFVK